MGSKEGDSTSVSADIGRVPACLFGGVSDVAAVGQEPSESAKRQRNEDPALKQEDVRQAVIDSGDRIRRNALH